MNFPLTEAEIKPKNLKTPWSSKGLKKSSKTKKGLYIKFLKSKSTKSEEKYKNYKKNQKYKYNTKQTWQVMKEITSKQKTKSSSLPKTIKN